jgi:hypothetical protein
MFTYSNVSLVLFVEIVFICIKLDAESIAYQPPNWAEKVTGFVCTGSFGDKEQDKDTTNEKKDKAKKQWFMFSDVMFNISKFNKNQNRRIKINTLNQEGLLRRSIVFIEHRRPCVFGSVGAA